MNKPTSEHEMKKMILRVVDDARLAAMRSDRRAQADLAAAEAGKKAWDRANPDDGVGCFSGCPYNPETRRDTAADARINHTMLDDTYRYAIEVFLDGNNQS